MTLIDKLWRDGRDSVHASVSTYVLNSSNNSISDFIWNVVSDSLWSRTEDFIEFSIESEITYKLKSYDFN